MKIGSVAPDAIHKNVKTFRENIKNFHFIAPEWTGEIILFLKGDDPNNRKTIVVDPHLTFLVDVDPDPLYSKSS